MLSKYCRPHSMAYNYHWLAPGYHQQVVCANTDCPLASPLYFDRLVATADRVAEQAEWIRRKNYSLVVPDARSSFNDPDDTLYFGIELTDFRIRNRYVMLESGGSGNNSNNNNNGLPPIPPPVLHTRNHQIAAASRQRQHILHLLQRRGSAGFADNQPSAEKNQQESEEVVYRRLAFEFKCVPQSSPAKMPRHRHHQNEHEILQGGSCNDDGLSLQFDGRMELLLWCLLNGRDLVGFKMEVEQNRKIIPSCVMSSLLFCALRAHYADGVKILLENGALPVLALANSGNALESLPIMCGFYNWETITASTSEAGEAETQMIDCLKVLLSHGADLLAKEKFSEAIPLHFLCHLAVRSAEASKAIIKMTPSYGLSASAIIQRWKRVIIGAVGPLEAVLVDLVAPNSEGEDERQIYPPAEHQRRVDAMLYGAAFPLLRAGAYLTRDPFEDPIGEPQLRLFAGFVASSHHFAELLTILTAGRRKTSLNLTKFAQNIQRLQQQQQGPGTFNDNHRFFFINFTNAPEDAAQLERTVNQLFPLKLQQICRIEILKRLPIGADARRAAIDQLCLPGCLGQFLNFEKL